MITPQICKLNSNVLSLYFKLKQTDMKTTHKELADLLIETQAFILEMSPIPVTKQQMDDNSIDGGLWDRINKAIKKATS